MLTLVASNDFSNIRLLAFDSSRVEHVSSAVDVDVIDRSNETLVRLKSGLPTGESA
jgi:hypothetical protein